MASKSANQGLPQGFKPPFKTLVQAKSRHDDVLACIATITETSLDDVWKLAISQSWLPATGQYWVSEQLIASLCQRLGGLRSTAWKDFVSFDAMPSVAILWVDPHKSDPENTGRAIIFHHVAAVKDQWPSFSYGIDVSESEPDKQIVTDLKRFTPTCYIEVTKGRSA